MPTHSGEDDSPSWVARLMPVFATLVGAGGLFLGASQFDRTMRSSYEQKYWEEQIRIYEKACDAAANISTSLSLEQNSGSRTTFWNLYWGEMNLVEHPEVKRAMVDFGNVVHEWEDTNRRPDESKMQMASYALADCCRKSLAKTWDVVKIGDLPSDPHGRGCPY